MKKFDSLINNQGYANRSEAIRDLMRDALVKSKLETSPEASEVLGSLTLVYDHRASELNKRTNDLQHDHHGLVYPYCLFTSITTNVWKSSSCAEHCLRSEN